MRRCPVARFVLGSGGELGPIRARLVRMLDPAEAFMRVDEPPRRTRPSAEQGWMTYRPGDPHSTGAIQNEGRPPETGAAERERVAAMQREMKPYLAARSNELVLRGETVVRRSRGTIAARLIRFRRGVAVLEVTSTNLLGDVEGHMKLRIDEDPSGARATMEECLAQKVLELGSDGRPISG